MRIIALIIVFCGLLQSAEYKEYLYDFKSNGVLHYVQLRQNKVNLFKDITSFGGASFYMFIAYSGFVRMGDGNFTLLDVVCLGGGAYCMNVSFCFARFYF